MSARRLPCAELPEVGASVVLDAAASKHARVLRLTAGMRVTLIDGRGGEGDATLVELGRGGVRCELTARRSIARAARQLHCVLGLPKGGKVEKVVRMLTELGVDGLHLVQCERSVPRPRDHAARLERLRRVALEACAQSGQPHAPQLHALSPLSEVAARAPAGASKLVFWEGGGAPLAEALPADAHPQALWAVVGPEGGLAESEVEQLRARGFVAVGLGPAILRVETAAVVVAGLLLERLGRLAGSDV